MKIPLTQIIANPEQPRTIFDQAELDSLAASLKDKGLLNPIAVEGPHEGIYILVDGERRCRAAKIAGWTEIEANVRPPLDGNGPTERLLLAMIGNSQRTDIGPIDEAKLYRRLRAMGYSAEEIARQAGRQVGIIYTRLRLLEFPDEIQVIINSKRLPISQKVFEALRKIDPDKAIIIARRAAAGGISESSIVALCKWAGHTRQAVSQKATVKSECPPLEMNKPLTDWYKGIRPALWATCKDCGMYENGGDKTICKDCPVVDFVRRLGE
jgi:ParB family chromosome partitioning protein